MENVTEPVLRLLDAANTDLAELYGRVVGFFDEKRHEQVPRTRKPSYAIRLIVPGEPPAHLVIKANWLYGERRLETGTLRLEVLWGDATATDMERVLILSIGADGYRAWHRLYPSV